jgi:hypothetical protein
MKQNRRKIDLEGGIGKVKQNGKEMRFEMRPMEKGALNGGRVVVRRDKWQFQPKPTAL